MNRSILLVLAAMLGSIAFGGNISICSTGFLSASSGCGAAVNSPASNNLSADGNWYVASNSSGTFLSQAYVTVNNAFPLQNAGPWLANNAVDSNGQGAGSSWITPSNNQAAVYANGTTTYFSTTFSLTGMNPALAQISGYWLADDYGAGIFLNGVTVGQTNLPVFGGLGGPMVPFNITNGSGGIGQGIFQAGNNVLTFGVVNDATNHGTINNNSQTPTGVRVVFTSATANVPEPGTLLLMGGGLVSLALLGRRRKA